jgi:tRNA(Ile)-lysidine synthase
VSCETVDLVRVLRDALHAAGALRPEERCLVALSGGRDSMVLLDLCAEVQRNEGVFVAATVDHGLRPFQAEARIAAGACTLRGIPWRLGALEAGLRDRARAAGRSLEDEARRERYAMLEHLADGAGATRILTAHTAEDQAETVLLRLLRGAGPGGLAGILPRRGPRILRPLLAAGRDAVAAWAADRKVPWIRDPGNVDDAIRRSRLRELLPALEAAAPGAAAVLARNASVAADHVEGLRAWVLEHFDLDTEACLPLELPLVRVGRGPAARVRLHALLGALGLGARIERAHVDALADLAEGAEGRRAALPGGLEAARRGDHLHLGLAAPTVAAAPVVIPGPGRYGTPLGALEISEEPPGAPGTDPRGEVLFDRAGVGFPLRLRAPCAGERLEVFGLQGHTRLVSDLLSEARIPRHLRALPRVLEDHAAQALWVAGCRRGAAAPVGQDTQAMVRVRLCPGEPA